MSSKIWQRHFGKLFQQQMLSERVGGNGGQEQPVIQVEFVLFAVQLYNLVLGNDVLTLKTLSEVMNHVSSLPRNTIACFLVPESQLRILFSLKNRMNCQKYIQTCQALQEIHFFL